MLRVLRVPTLRVPMLTALRLRADSRRGDFALDGLGKAVKLRRALPCVEKRNLEIDGGQVDGHLAGAGLEKLDVTSLGKPPPSRKARLL